MHYRVTIILFAIFYGVQKAAGTSLRDEDIRISKLLMDAVDKGKIEENLKALTKTMHRAGTPEGLKVADYIQKQFTEYGLKPVETEDYDVLLSYPNPDEPDQVTLMEENGKDTVISDGHSKILEKSESNSADADLRFLAYSKPGTAISKNLVYANYGREEDFKYLLEQGVAVNGSVALIRYGFQWRGTKVRLAQLFGAVGVILYSDPIDYHGQQFQTLNDTYPKTDHLPPTDVQRGTVAAEDNGDILTPLLPAKDYVSRKSVEFMTSQGKLPAIPATVIGFGEAQKLIEKLEGSKAPRNWQGALPTVYNLGPRIRGGAKIKVSSNGILERRTIRNVIGYLKGTSEPDRYVILGNHHDAWTYGGLDPSSGTTAMLEAARALTSLKKSGWAPRRTMVFCAWDGEEYGLIGSTEWVEQNLVRIQNQAVAYLNVDTAVTGHYSVFARGVPSLKAALYDAARRVPNPNDDEVKDGVKTVFDSWSKSAHSEDPGIASLVGSGSDYKAFLHYAGVPVMDLRYGSFDRTYPLYHTMHDTMHFVKHFTDPKFIYHEAVTRLWAEYARIMADSPLIPLNIDDLGNEVTQHYDGFQRRVSHILFPFRVDLAPIAAGVSQFRSATKTFHARFKSMSNEIISTSDLQTKFPEIRAMNDRLMQLERMFIEPQGTPSRPSVRHTLYGPGVTDSYSGVLFPGLDAALTDAISSKQDTDEKERIVMEQISWVATCLHAAADWLNRDF